MYSSQSDAMPSDKMMKLFIIQMISSFVGRDYDSGLHFLNEIKLSYAQNMDTLNPTLKILAKEIIQSLDLFTPGARAQDLAAANTSDDSGTQLDGEEALEYSDAGSGTGSVASELQDLLSRRRARRASKKK